MSKQICFLLVGKHWVCRWPWTLWAHPQTRTPTQNFEPDKSSVLYLVILQALNLHETLLLVLGLGASFSAWRYSSAQKDWSRILFSRPAEISLHSHRGSGFQGENVTHHFYPSDLIPIFLHISGNCGIQFPKIIINNSNTKPVCWRQSLWLCAPLYDRLSCRLVPWGSSSWTMDTPSVTRTGKSFLSAGFLCRGVV